MNRKLAVIFTIILGCLLLVNCGGKSELHQTQDRTPGGLPRMAPQIDQNYKGTTVIPEEIKYPGMELFDAKASVDFTSSDSPDTIADWFKNTLNATPSKKDLSGDYKWVITAKGFDIEVYNYNGGSHLRYKRKINN